MSRVKGWAHATAPSRNRATHYVDGNPDEVSEESRSLCDRSPIRLIASGLKKLSPARQKAYRALEICDHCQNAARKRKR